MVAQRTECIEPCGPLCDAAVRGGLSLVSDPPAAWQAAALDAAADEIGGLGAILEDRSALVWFEDNNVGSSPLDGPCSTSPRATPHRR